jgi:hypothetical protein
MKKIYLIIFIGITSFSCEEDFSPYGEFKEKYIFNCVLRGDSTIQIAALSKSYNPANFNPDLITEDASIMGADIRILIGDSVYVFKDSTANRIDTTRYKKPFRFYFNSRLELIPNRDVDVEVLLPNGRRIQSRSKTPPKIQFDQRSADVISDQSPNLSQFIWNISFSGQYFSPRMFITYTKNVNGTNKLMTKLVPNKYERDGRNEIPIYPQIGVQSTLNIEKQAISKALDEISLGDPNKQNYTIYEFATVQVLALDQNLSRYYSTTNGSLDDLTVRIDEKDYSNIEGGFGIFASYIKGEYKIKFSPSYILSFGYKILIGS